MSTGGRASQPARIVGDRRLWGRRRARNRCFMRLHRRRCRPLMKTRRRRNVAKAHPVAGIRMKYKRTKLMRCERMTSYLRNGIQILTRGLTTSISSCSIRRGRKLKSSPPRYWSTTLLGTLFRRSNNETSHLLTPAISDNAGFGHLYCSRYWPLGYSSSLTECVCGS